jgi:hypothetical protein
MLEMVSLSCCGLLIGHLAARQRAPVRGALCALFVIVADIAAKHSW